MRKPMLILTSFHGKVSNGRLCESHFNKTMRHKAIKSTNISSCCDFGFFFYEARILSCIVLSFLDYLNSKSRFLIHKIRKAAHKLPGISCFWLSCSLSESRSPSQPVVPLMSHCSYHFISAPILNTISNFRLFPSSWSLYFLSHLCCGL